MLNRSVDLPLRLIVVCVAEPLTFKEEICIKTKLTFKPELSQDHKLLLLMTG